MAYTPLPIDLSDLTTENIEEIAHDLLQRKEFYQFASDPGRNFRDPNEFDALHGKHLRLRSHQLFTQNLVNANTPYKRLLIKWKTGTGKTSGAIAIAASLIQVYGRIFADRLMQLGSGRIAHITADKMTPSVFVIGFTKLNIVKELLKYPEFGFITHEEKKELAELRTFAASSADHAKKLKELSLSIKHRIGNKARGGFYKFFGYQEFVNRLFISEEINLTDLENLATTRTLEEVIHEHIAAGRIQINEDLVSQFENSLIICDEIHNTYNSQMKNNYGVAIQYILDAVPSVRAVFLTATPINNAPSEIIEVMNYLLPTRIRKQDFFDSNRISDEALERLGKLSFGRVSFVQDANPRYYPATTNEGKVRKLRHVIGDTVAIPYLRFTECPMSEIHARTYKKFLNDTQQINIDVESAEQIVMAADSYSIVDMVFPAIEGDEIGLFKSNEVYANYQTANATQLAKRGITITKNKEGITVSGDWLAPDRIAKYSTKLDTVRRLIDESFERSRAALKESNVNAAQVGEKMLIYHDRVKMSGIQLVEEFLLRLDILDEISAPVDATRCAICGGGMGNHKKFIAKEHLADHAYTPARFVSAHSDIDRGDMLESIDRYNAPDNSYGVNIRFLLGSKLIRESYDIKDTRVLIVMSLPTHISGLVQLNGRVDRQDSHSGLTPDKRTVAVYYLLTTIPDNESSIDTVSPEEYRYTSKLIDYMEIQRIEKKIHEYALDGGIHRETIMPQSLKERYERPDDPSTNRLAPLYYETKFPAPEYSLRELNLTTFNARGHSIVECKTILRIIKQLFMKQPAWTYADLWNAVKAPSFGLEVNPALFSESNYAIALDNLTQSRGLTFDDESSTAVMRLFDPNDLYIRIGEIKYVIVHVGAFYIRAQIIDGHVVRDVELLGRSIEQPKQIRINVNRWLSESKSEHNYEAEKRKFINMYLDRAEHIAEIIGEYTPDFYRRILQEAIAAEIHDDTNEVYSEVIKLFDKFGAIVRVRDVLANLTVAEKMTGGQIIVHKKSNVSSEFAPATSIGFVDGDMVSVFDSPTWVRFHKSEFGFGGVKHVENFNIVGYFDTQVNGQPKFKIRRSVQAIAKSISGKRQNEVADTRTVERGIVCATKTKPELIAILKSLGGKHTSDLKIRSLCVEIQNALIAKEMAARKSGSKVKYLYMWFDVHPDLSNIGNAK